MRIRYVAWVLSASLIAAASSVWAESLTPAAQEQAVRDYVSAFNAHDTGAMLRMVTDDVQWLSVDGDSITVETGSKQALGRSMDEYFAGCSDCSAHLLQMFSTGTRVSALEQAGPGNAEGERAQSLSVYEFSGTLIRRVYYYPAEKQPRPATR